jgi:hypothetical protein
MAYKDGSFKIKEMEKLEFSAWWMKKRSQYQEVLVAESRGRLVCFIGAYFDGWTYTPHVEMFKCSTKREKLEGTIEFFKWLKSMDTIGVVVVKSLKESVGLFDHICKRGCLEYIGAVPKGDYRGTEYIYSTTGNAIKPVATATPTAGRL